MLAAALGTILFAPRNLLGHLAPTFFALVLEGLPFLLLGSFVGGLLEVYLPKEFLLRRFSHRPGPSILVGAGLGFLFPVCECGIVPVVRRLLRKGLPIGGGVAFLLGGPIVNPLVAASTWLAYRGEPWMPVFRVALGYLIAVAAGWAFMQWAHGSRAILRPVPEAAPDGAQDTGAAGTPRLRRALAHAAGDFLDIGRFFVFGALFASLLQSLVPREAVVSWAQASPESSILAMMGLAFGLNLCSEADAFIAASFRTVGLPFAAQLAFLLLGPMLDLKLLVQYRALFKPRAAAVLAALVALLVLGASLACTGVAP